MSARSIVAVLGPGILYAAAAVGISHLVQATRAGAGFGLGLVSIVIIACVLKYPALRFGGDYAAITGRSLISNYYAQGKAVFALYAFSQLFSMVFVIAAISLFTAGLVQAALGIDVQPLIGVVVLLVFTSTLLVLGHYRVLEGATKLIVGVFTLLIVAAVLMVIDGLTVSASSFMLPALSAPTVLFIVALIGFMPTPADGSVLQSLWTVEKSKQQAERVRLEDAQLDFNIGYIGSVLLAIGFIVLGTVLMHQPGVEVAKGNAGFAGQLFGLFTAAIGEWSYPLIAVAAIFVMFSTLLAVFDGMTRVVLAIWAELQPVPDSNSSASKLYNIALISLGCLAVLVLSTMMKSFATFMDMTSIIVFLISPLIAFLNHRAIFNTDVPEKDQPGNLIRIWSLLGITSLLLLGFIYFYYRLLG